MYHIQDEGSQYRKDVHPSQINVHNKFSKIPATFIGTWQSYSGKIWKFIWKNHQVRQSSKEKKTQITVIS